MKMLNWLNENKVSNNLVISSKDIKANFDRIIEKIIDKD